MKFITLLFCTLFLHINCRRVNNNVRSVHIRSAGDDDNDQELNSTTYIVGGRTAEQGKYPWTVRLEVYYPGVTNSYGVCGAVLWNQQHVVTAAHCFSDCQMNLFAENILVCIGDYDRTIQDGEICYWADNWWSHEGYPFCNDQNKQNDIAVIRVSGGMRVPYWGQNNVGNTNFPWTPNNNWYEGYAQFTGWGAQNPNANGDPNFPNRMKVVDLPLMTVEQCQLHWPQVDYSQVCAGGVDGENSCRGDSGGPLVWPSNGWSTILGVSSFGPVVCATGGKPNVFTRIAYFRGWIENKAGSAGTPS